MVNSVRCVGRFFQYDSRICPAKTVRHYRGASSGAFRRPRHAFTRDGKADSVHGCGGNRRFESGLLGHNPVSQHKRGLD
jgi:hypothetical protein